MGFFLFIFFLIQVLVLCGECMTTGISVWHTVRSLSHGIRLKDRIG